MKHYVVKFRKTSGGLREFHRWADTADAAVEDAKEGFQWAYGYWPADPVDISEVSE